MLVILLDPIAHNAVPNKCQFECSNIIVDRFLSDLFKLFFVLDSNNVSFNLFIFNIKIILLQKFRNCIC